MKKPILKYFCSFLLLIICINLANNSFAISGSSKSLFAATINYAVNTTGYTQQTSLIGGQTGVVICGFSATPAGGNVSLAANWYMDFTTGSNPMGLFSSVTLWVSTTGTYADAVQVTGASGANAGGGLRVTIPAATTLNSGTTYSYYVVANVASPITTTARDIGFLLIKTGGTTYNGPLATTNISFTTASVSLTGNNTAAAGITQGPLFYGQTGIVLFSFKLTVQGALTIKDINIPATAGIQSFVTGSLYRSNTPYFTDAQVISGAVVTLNAKTTIAFGTTAWQTFTASAPTTYYYFIVADFTKAPNTSEISVQYNFTSGQSPAAINNSGGSTEKFNTFTTTDGVAFTMPLVYKWLGGVSDSFSDPGNFKTAKLANVNNISAISSNVLVEIGMDAYTHAPKITQATTNIGGIVFGNTQSNPTLTIASGSTLTLGKSVSVISGTNATISGGTLSISSTASSVVNSASTLNMTGGTAVTNNGVFKVSSTGILNVNGNSTLTNSGTGTFTLQSDINGSASIGSLTDAAGTTTTGTIAGAYNVERYITGNSANSRGYRLLSSPVSVSGSSQIIPNLTYIANSAYTTGSTGTDGGFAATGNPTIYLYRENIAPSNNSFTAGNNRGISTINTGSSFTINGDDGSYNIPAGNGILFFFRGDKATTTNPTTSTTIAQPSTFSVSGYLNQGNIVVKNWFTPASSNLSYTSNTANTNVRGFNLVGNPYASSINWDKWNTLALPETNISNKIWTYNPKLKVYATYIAGGGGVGTNTTGTTANIIPSGEGFFVRATDVNPALTFTENAKVTTQVPAADLMLAGATSDVTAPMQYLRVQVMKDSLNAEDALIFFKSKAKPEYVQNEDAEYLKGNSVVNISTQSTDKIALAINQLALPKKTQVIPLNVNVTSSGTFSLNLSEAKNIPAVYDIWLMDAYKNDSLDIKHNPHYSFTANTGDAASFGSARFSVAIRPNPALTVHLLNFDAIKSTNNVKIKWTAENEAAYTTYIVERSTDAGKTYKVLDSLTSAGLGNYDELDPSPVLGDNYYRLKQIDVTGNISYSNVIKVMYANTANTILAKSNISVYPNPALSTLNLAITNINTTNNATTLSSASYKISITNSVGLVVKTETSTNPNWQGQIDNLMPGTYFIQVINTKDNTLTGKSTFVKL